MRATRGRIDRPFVVNAGNVYQKLGKGEQIRLNALNEAWVHVVEALNNGAYEAVVYRLNVEGAKIKYAVCRKTPPATEGGQQGNAGEAPAAPYTFTVEDALPKDEYLFAVKHLECFNDGIKIAFLADEKTDADNAAVGNDRLTLRLQDKDGSTLYEFVGSLDPDAKDDYGVSAYLPDVIASQTDAVEVTIGVTGDKAVVDPGKVGYGFTENGAQNWCESAVLVCFEEGGTAYTTQDYQRAREALQYCPQDFAYISSGGSQSPALLAQLAQLAFDTNRQLRFDVPGNLTPDAAIAFVSQLNLGASKTAHLLQAFWAPFQSADPTGVNPKGYYGCATLNIAYACARNAAKNAQGFAAKNYPIAGKNFPVNRQGMEQTVTLRSQDLSKIAKAKINPVVYDTFTSGGLYVFKDSLTLAQVESSLKKLIAVADMSTSVDDMVTKTGKDMLQLPMAVAVKRMKDFLRDYFEAAQASGWLVPSNDPSMGGAAFRFEVVPNAMKPYEKMDVHYWLRYDGTVRQIEVTQTLTK